MIHDVLIFINCVALGFSIMITVGLLLKFYNIPNWDDWE